jgi:hypothetical protein
MDNIIQYGAIFKAANCKLDFQSKSASIEVVEIPSKSKSTIQAAIDDVSKFEDTANYTDGMAALNLSDFIDGEPNPLSDSVRDNVLTSLGIMKEGRFVAQALAQQKTNRSWHVSKTPNECSYFGDICTHRGIKSVPGKRGRKSSRKPDQYHTLSNSGVIGREQLVTPALENLMGVIPVENLISVTGGVGSLNIINLNEMDQEQLEELWQRIKALKEAVGE